MPSCVYRLNNLRSLCLACFGKRFLLSAELATENTMVDKLCCCHMRIYCAGTRCLATVPCTGHSEKLATLLISQWALVVATATVCFNEIARHKVRGYSCTTMQVDSSPDLCITRAFTTKKVGRQRALCKKETRFVLQSLPRTLPIAPHSPYIRRGHSSTY